MTEEPQKTERDAVKELDVLVQGVETQLRKYKIGL